MKLTVFFISIFVMLGSFSGKAQVKVAGIVFFDKNENSVYDAGDVPLSNISVSSLHLITQTNSKGEFNIELNSKDIVFVIKPSEYEFILKPDNIPDFYKICYSHKSPNNFKYQGIEELFSAKDTLFFPLYKAETKEKHSVQIIGDIQAPTTKEVEFFQNLIVPELFQHPADFKVCLGDIADNNLDIYPSIISTMKAVQTPLYMVAGNHDVNYHAQDYTTQTETFRKHFGPDYYSFNYGETHFVVLNTVIYKGWNETDKRNGSYTGGVHAEQLAWLKQDLKLIPNDQQVVLLAHIPLMRAFVDSVHLAEVFSAFENKEKLLAIYGHVHNSGGWVYDSTFDWKYKGKFIGHVAGAACGSWWVGPYGLDSIPDATCTDGTPAGIYRYNFEKNSYSKDFIAAGKSSNHQLRISHPASTLNKDSISQFIYVNVFDGDENTKVTFNINNGIQLKMEKVLEVDPFMIRNQYLRYNRVNWKPGLGQCAHLWKAEIPTNLELGKHTIQATCELSNGKRYSTQKIFELVNE